MRPWAWVASGTRASPAGLPEGPCQPPALWGGKGEPLLSPRQGTSHLTGTRTGFSVCGIGTRADGRERACGCPRGSGRERGPGCRLEAQLCLLLAVRHGLPGSLSVLHEEEFQPRLPGGGDATWAPVGKAVTRGLGYARSAGAFPATVAPEHWALGLPWAEHHGETEAERGPRSAASLNLKEASDRPGPRVCISL